MRESSGVSFGVTDGACIVRNSVNFFTYAAMGRTVYTSSKIVNR